MPDARSVLTLVRKMYSSSSSVSCRFAQTYAPAGFPAAAPETGRLTLQAPDKVRFDYDGAEGKLFTFDGTAARQYVAADRQIVVRSLTAEDRARLPLLFFESPEGTLSRYTATAKAGADGRSDVTLSPIAGGEPKSLELTVTASGEDVTLAVTDSQGNTTRFTFQERKAGGPLPLSFFAFAPPPGTKVLSD